MGAWLRTVGIAASVALLAASCAGEEFTSGDADDENGGGTGNSGGASGSGTTGGKANGGSGNVSGDAGDDSGGASGSSSGGSSNGGSSTGGSSNGGSAGDAGSAPGGRGGGGGRSGAGNGGSASGSGGRGGAGSGGTSGRGGAGSGGTLGKAGGGGSAGTIVIGGSGGAGGMRTCPTNVRGATMIHVAVENGNSYCVDRTEVTNAEYLTYLNAPSIDPVPVGVCAWDTTHVPSADWPPDDANAANRPVVWVDWCDAHAYCAYAGKRLCGRVGGGPVAHDPVAAGEWYRACSGGTGLTYPYGNSYSGSACNGLDNGAGSTVAVGSKTTCVGGYAGIYDMSGNVLEWDDSCASSNGATDLCRARGGSYQQTSGNLICANVDSTHRQTKLAHLGFRCCADAD